MAEQKRQVKAWRMGARALLRRRLHDYDMNVLELARAAGIAHATADKVVNGGTFEPWQRTRAGICRALDIAPAVLDAALMVDMDALMAEGKGWTGKAR